MRDVLIRSTDGLSEGARVLVRENDMDVSAAIRYAERVARMAEMNGSPLMREYSAIAAELRAVRGTAAQESGAGPWEPARD